MSQLNRLDGRIVPERGRECRAFMVVRNEALRLPYVLDYHRSLGIARFFIVDNISDDGTIDIALDQPDCHVYSAPGSFAAANSGIVWVNQLIAWHGQDHWCLLIDADECLVYPECEAIDLPHLCEYMTQTEAEGLFAVMLDMYSDKPIVEAVYRPGTPFLDTCPFFDKDYRFRRRTGVRPFPTHEFIGGPRLRRFYSEFMEAGVVGWNVPKLVRSMRSKIGIASATWGATPPLLVKIPLIRGGRGQWITNHKTTSLALADVTGAVLHFKYFSDFHDRVQTARTERQHFDAAAEYARYEAALQQDPTLSFYYAGSQRYRHSGDLVRYNFMRSPQSYRHFFNIDQLAG